MFKKNGAGNPRVNEQSADRQKLEEARYKAEQAFRRSGFSREEIYRVYGLNADGNWLDDRQKLEEARDQAEQAFQRGGLDREQAYGTYGPDANGNRLKK